MKIPPKLVGTLGYGIYRMLCSTLRFEVTGRKFVENSLAESSCIAALWHDETFPLMQVRNNLPMMGIVSQSRDGEYMAQLLQRLEVATVRGSSSRGGVKALLAAMRKLQEEKTCICITVDGPRGPRHKAKGGALFLAKSLQIPIHPVRVFMENSYKFNSWDRFQVPLPFSKIKVVSGAPWYVQSDIHDPEAMKKEREALEHRLEELTP